MDDDQLFDDHREDRIDTPIVVTRLRAMGFAVAGALALAATLAPLAQAGVDAQHNETLVVL